MPLYPTTTTVATKQNGLFAQTADSIEITTNIERSLIGSCLLELILKLQSI